MIGFLSSSVFFGATVSILSYLAGDYFKKKYKFAFLNPLLISIVITILVLLAFRIDYNTYYEGARYISYLLTPATVCLAIPLYEKIDLLKHNLKAIILGIVSGVITSGLCIYTMSMIFRLSHKEYVTLLPKSITTAIGMGVSEELSGYVTITVAVIVITGVIGNIIAESVCKIFKITEPVAKGIGIGSASHAIGTSRAIEMGETEGAMSSLSIAVSGLLTVIAAPIFALLI